MAARPPRGRRSDHVEIDIASDDIASQEGIEEGTGENEGEIDDADEDDEEVQDIELLEDPPFPPPGLKEISSLASWTVSSAKPGNGVAALRSPDTSLFWQSDGPQPHLLSIHFFKLVSIVHMRIYLDFLADESYTPTKVSFWAGMGEYDLMEFAEMAFEQPMGWIDVDFSHVGPYQTEDGDGEGEGAGGVDWSKRPVLRCFLVQVRILENHQNGKDTHLRAVQLFARDEVQEPRMRPVARRQGRVVPLLGKEEAKTVQGRKVATRESNNIKLASWMMEPDLR